LGGLFGVVSNENCAEYLFYGTDYHTHLGAIFAGLALYSDEVVKNQIHDITNSQFRSRFEGYAQGIEGNAGIGVISDYDPQSLSFRSQLGRYAIVTVGKINNIEKIANEAEERGAQFSEFDEGKRIPTEVVSSLINQGNTFEEGIQIAQEAIEGSCSLLLLTKDGIYAARDKLGRTPIIIGKKEGSYAATSETCAFLNLGFGIDKYLGPGEIVLMTPDGYEQIKEPGDKMQMCSFLWVYYGYPASSYEEINVEKTRNKCGEFLAKGDDVEVDVVSAIPDSGTGHAIGYANERNLPFRRAFIKYTPTWARSFMPQAQEERDLIAKMKLLPIQEIVQGERLLFCEDSIVRGTQLKDNIQRLYACGAKEVHMRPACPPLIYSCGFLDFSRSRSVDELAAIKTIKELEGADKITKGLIKKYSNPSSEEYHEMVERIGGELRLSSLEYQNLGDLVEAIGLPKKDLCTHCWDGSSYF